VPRSEDKNVIGTKWVLWNKLDENGKVMRNKERLVCKGYTQVKGIDFEEKYAPVNQMEVIWIFLAFVAFKDFKVYQMDVKSTFLNGGLKEELYIEQSKEFKFGSDPDVVWRLKKALFGLKQEPKAWYGRLDKYFIG